MPLTLAEEVEELAARTERARAAFLGLGLGSGEILELVRPAAGGARSNGRMRARVCVCLARRVAARRLGPALTRGCCRAQNSFYLLLMRLGCFEGMDVSLSHTAAAEEWRLAVPSATAEKIDLNQFLACVPLPPAASTAPRDASRRRIVLRARLAHATLPLSLRGRLGAGTTASGWSCSGRTRSRRSARVRRSTRATATATGS